MPPATQPARSKAANRPGRLLDRAGRTARDLWARTQPLRAALRPAAVALRPAIAAVRPALAVIQPPGWAALGTLVVCVFVGFRLDWQELLAVAVVLLVILLGAIAFIIGRSTYAVTLDVARLRVTVGDNAFGGLTVANASTRALLPSLFLMPVGQVVTTFPVPRLAGEARHEEVFALDTSRRSVVGIGPVRSSRGDGIGLLRREVYWTGVHELFIHPPTVSLANTSAGFLKDLEGRPTDTLSSSDIAFHALREYQVGDDTRHIHWLSSARTGKLLVRQFEETRRSHLVVCLSMTPEDYDTPADFELAVSVAASFGRQMIKEEKDLTVQVPGHRLRVESANRLLDDFARLQYGPPCEPLETIALAAAGAAPNASVAVVVTGAQAGPTRLHRAVARFGVDVRTAAICCQTGAALGRGTIGATPVLTIGALQDLPRVVRSLGA